MTFCLYAPFFSPSGYSVAAHMDALALERLGVPFECRPTIDYIDTRVLHGESDAIVRGHLVKSASGLKRWLRDEPVRNTPAPHLRVAWAPFRECPRWPREWIAALNANAAVVVTPAAWLSEGARDSGLEVPVVECPVAWDWKIPARPEAPQGDSERIWREAVMRGEFGAATDHGYGRRQVLWDGAFYSRKNLEGAVRAFWMAVRDPDEAELFMRVTCYAPEHVALLWITMHALAREAAERNKCQITQLPRVRWIHDALTMDEVQSLHLGCDVYLSLARAEGVGYGALIAAGWGKPCVLTDEPGLRATVPRGLFVRTRQIQARQAFDICPIQTGRMPIAGMDRNDPWWDADLEDAAGVLGAALSGSRSFITSAAGEVVRRHGPEAVGRRIVEIVEGL